MTQFPRAALPTPRGKSATAIHLASSQPQDALKVLRHRALPLATASLVQAPPLQVSIVNGKLPIVHSILVHSPARRKKFQPDALAFQKLSARLMPNVNGKLPNVHIPIVHSPARRNKHHLPHALVFQKQIAHPTLASGTAISVNAST